MPYRAVLFDLDGTLLDTLDDIADATNAALRRQGFPEHPRDAYKIFVGDGVATLMRRVVPREAQSEQTLQACGAVMREEYGRHWAVKSKPYPGVPELLDGLAQRGIPLAVLTNKPHEFAQLCVARLLPRWKFAVVLGEHAAVVKKPDPAGALEISRRLGVAPAEIAYLGDTDTDMQTAVAAGMVPLGALWGFRGAEELLANGATMLLAKPLDLLRLFGE